MAFARVKMHWEKMKATVVATEGPPEGKDHRKRSDTSTMSWRVPDE